MKKFWLQVAGLLIAIFAGISLSLNPEAFFGVLNPSSTPKTATPVPFAVKQLRIVDNQSFSQNGIGAIPKVLVNVDIADTPEKRKIGLGGRTTLADNTGMLFIFDAPGIFRFWMKGMVIPLDFIWLYQNRVVDLTENVQPPMSGQADQELPTYSPKTQVDSMLEVPAGFVLKNGIVVGDIVEEVQ